MVYHGPTDGAEPYFGTLNYKIPKGESVADWLIDISSGRLEPTVTSSLDRISANSSLETMIDHSTKRKRSNHGVITDENCVGEKGVTMGKVVR